MRLQYLTIIILLIASYNQCYETISTQEQTPLEFIKENKLAPGKVMYIPISALIPGQLRYAILNVKDKIKKAQDKGSVIGSNGASQYKYNNNSSILSIQEAVPVVISPVGLVLVDGHHDVLSSLALGATTIPIKIMKDMSHYAPKEFWQIAYQEGYVYPYTLDRQWKIPKNFTELVDDPNRYFAAITARKCFFIKDKNDQPEFDLDSGDYRFIIAQKGPESPLWLKIDKDIPFAEFMISDVLNNAGFREYTNEMAQNIPQAVIEKARMILHTAIERGKKSNIQGAHLTDDQLLYEKIKKLHLVPFGISGNQIKGCTLPKTKESFESIKKTILREVQAAEKMVQHKLEEMKAKNLPRTLFEKYKTQLDKYLNQMKQEAQKVISRKKEDLKNTSHELQSNFKKKIEQIKKIDE